MSEDARNSIYLWTGSIAFFAYFWATTSFDLLPQIPDDWFLPLIGLFLLVNVADFIRLLWMRRASDKKNAGKN